MHKLAQVLLRAAGRQSFHAGSKTSCAMLAPPGSEGSCADKLIAIITVDSPTASPFPSKDKAVYFNFFCLTLSSYLTNHHTGSQIDTRTHTHSFRHVNFFCFAPQVITAFILLTSKKKKKN